MQEHGNVAVATQAADARPPSLPSPPVSAQHNNRYGSLQLNLHQRAGSGSSSESVYESVREQTSPCEDADAAATPTPTPQPATTPSAFHARRQALRQEEIARDFLEAYTAEYGGGVGVPASMVANPIYLDASLDASLDAGSNPFRPLAWGHVGRHQHADQGQQVGASTPDEPAPAPSPLSTCRLLEGLQDGGVWPPHMRSARRRGEDGGRIPARMPRVALSQPLPLSRDVEDRITSLGPGLPLQHKAILWLGIALDLGAKASLCVSLRRFAHRGKWWWFGLTLAFLALSSLVSTLYWMTHYPAALAGPEPRSGAPEGPHADEAPAAQAYGLRKGNIRRWVRRLGITCAALQLGTAFAATRALMCSERRQRLVEMDLRGMRLADTLFLTLAVACLQIYVGMRCSSPFPDSCMFRPVHGFDWMLAASVAASLSSSALCFMGLEMNDHRLQVDRSHTLELGALFCYRLAEVAARLTLLALFANMHGFWVLLVVGTHAVAVLLLARCSPLQGQDRVWRKLAGSQASDARLLLACMAWPGIFASDATDRDGKFWWRGRMCGRKSTCDVTLKSRIVPFPLHSCLVAAEASILLGLMWGTGVPGWAQAYLGVAALLHALWGFLGMLWLATVHTISVAQHRDDISRAAALQDFLHMKALQALLPKGKGSRLLPVLSEEVEGEASLEDCQSLEGSAQHAAEATQPRQEPGCMEGSPLRRSVGAVAIRLPAAQFDEGPQSCPVWSAAAPAKFIEV